MDAMREENGKLAAYAWPGGYPILYVTSDGDVLCPECANGGNGSLARTENDPDDCPNDGWHIVGCDVHWEGPSEVCCHCGAEIESAYGDPDSDKGE